MTIVRYDHVDGVHTSENVYLLRDILQERNDIDVTVRFTMRNTGSIAGSEITQLYLVAFTLSAISAHIEGILKNIPWRPVGA